MCGIVGAFDLSKENHKRSFDLMKLFSMARSIQHRGPDESTYWHSPGIAMAVNRLNMRGGSIGRQPVCDIHKKVYLSANAEIYNDKEISLLLNLKETPSSDTELWPHLYLKYGKDLFRYINGQFAIAIYDSRNKSLFLARDRIGILPLYYTIVDNWLLWSSEIKGILASGLINVEPDLFGIDHLFTFFATGSNTCFKNIHTIEPGSYIKFQENQIEKNIYYEFKFQILKPELNPRDLIHQAKHLLKDSLQKRLQADRPVGFYLSSGLDSSLLTTLAAKLISPEQLTAFSIGFKNGNNETGQAYHTAKQSGMNLIPLLVEEDDILNALPEVILSCESPIMDTAISPLLLLAKLVKQQGYKGVITGEGGDELFGGYIWNRFWQIPGSKLIIKALEKLTTPGINTIPLKSYLGDTHFALLSIYNTMNRAKFLFYSHEMKNSILNHNPFSGSFVNTNHLRNLDSLHRSLYFENRIMLPGHLLSLKGDRISMHSGIETRHPFLDNHLVEFACSLPSEYKIRFLREKWILRKIAESEGLFHIAKLNKTMFKAKPICHFKKKPEWINELLSYESIKATGYFDIHKIRKEQKIQNTKSDFSLRRFATDGTYTAVIMTQLWHHLFINKNLCSLPGFNYYSQENSKLIFVE